MTDTYATYWTPLATAINSELGTITGVNGVVEGNLPVLGRKLSESLDRVAYFYFMEEPDGVAKGITVAIIPPVFRIKVGIVGESGSVKGTWLTETAMRLKDWMDDKIAAGSTFSSTCKGFYRTGNVKAIYGSVQFAELEIIAEC